MSGSSTAVAVAPERISKVETDDDDDGECSALGMFESVMALPKVFMIAH